MEGNGEIQEFDEQFNFIYNFCIEQLYNLAFYSIGNGTIAEDITILAFSEAFHSIPDKSDVNFFRKRSLQLLFRYIRKGQKDTEIKLAKSEKREGIKNPYCADKQLLDKFDQIDYSERFILLLYYWQGFTMKQIAEITSKPIFLIKKQLHATLKKLC